ncbi:MAG: hypothetical protein LBT40_07650 [Deltaproteobacteria bacterium]|jgi:hypothetical protein|nr:hypothetical protein [Deltaproteobacteria bacterium]
MTHNDKRAKVFVKVPCPDQMVHVRVYPPDSLMDVKISPEGLALEIKVYPRGRTVEVQVAPAPDSGDDGDPGTWIIGPGGSFPGTGGPGTAGPVDAGPGGAGTDGPSGVSGPGPFGGVSGASAPGSEDGASGASGPGSDHDVSGVFIPGEGDGASGISAHGADDDASGSSDAGASSDGGAGGGPAAPDSTFAGMGGSQLGKDIDLSALDASDTSAREAASFLEAFASSQGERAREPEGDGRPSSSFTVQPLPAEDSSFPLAEAPLADEPPTPEEIAESSRTPPRIIDVAQTAEDVSRTAAEAPAGDGPANLAFPDAVDDEEPYDEDLPFEEIQYGRDEDAQLEEDMPAVSVTPAEEPVGSGRDTASPSFVEGGAVPPARPAGGPVTGLPHGLGGDPFARAALGHTDSDVTPEPGEPASPADEVFGPGLDPGSREFFEDAPPPLVERIPVTEITSELRGVSGAGPAVSGPAAPSAAPVASPAGGAFGAGLDPASRDFIEGAPPPLVERFPVTEITSELRGAPGAARVGPGTPGVPATSGPPPVTVPADGTSGPVPAWNGVFGAALDGDARSFIEESPFPKIGERPVAEAISELAAPPPPASPATSSGPSSEEIAAAPATSSGPPSEEIAAAPATSSGPPSDEIAAAPATSSGPSADKVPSAAPAAVPGQAAPVSSGSSGPGAASPGSPASVKAAGLRPAAPDVAGPATSSAGSQAPVKASELRPAGSEPPAPQSTSAASGGSAPVPAGDLLSAPVSVVGPGADRPVAPADDVLPAPVHDMAPAPAPAVGPPAAAPVHDMTPAPAPAVGPSAAAPVPDMTPGFVPAVGSPAPAPVRDMPSAAATAGDAEETSPGGAEEAPDPEAEAQAAVLSRLLADGRHDAGDVGRAEDDAREGADFADILAAGDGGTTHVAEIDETPGPVDIPGIDMPDGPWGPSGPAVSEAMAVIAGGTEPAGGPGTGAGRTPRKTVISLDDFAEDAVDTAARGQRLPGGPALAEISLHVSDFDPDLDVLPEDADGGTDEDAEPFTVESGSLAGAPVKRSGAPVPGTPPASGPEAESPPELVTASPADLLADYASALAAPGSFLEDLDLDEAPPVPAAGPQGDLEDLDYEPPSSGSAAPDPAESLVSLDGPGVPEMPAPALRGSWQEASPAVPVTAPGTDGHAPVTDADLPASLGDVDGDAAESGAAADPAGPEPAPGPEGPASGHAADLPASLGDVDGDAVETEAVAGPAAPEPAPGLEGTGPVPDEDLPGSFGDLDVPAVPDPAAGLAKPGSGPDEDLPGSFGDLDVPAVPDPAAGLAEPGSWPDEDLLASLGDGDGDAVEAGPAVQDLAPALEGQASDLYGDLLDGPGMQAAPAVPDPGPGLEGPDFELYGDLLDGPGAEAAPSVPEPGPGLGEPDFELYGDLLDGPGTGAAPAVPDPTPGPAGPASGQDGSLSLSGDGSPGSLLDFGEISPDALSGDISGDISGDGLSADPAGSPAADQEIDPDAVSGAEREAAVQLEEEGEEAEAEETEESEDSEAQEEAELLSGDDGGEAWPDLGGPVSAGRPDLAPGPDGGAVPDPEAVLREASASAASSGSRPSASLWADPARRIGTSRESGLREEGDAPPQAAMSDFLESNSDYVGADTGYVEGMAPAPQETPPFERVRGVATLETPYSSGPGGGRSRPETSTAVIVNYLDDRDDGMFGADPEAGELGAEEDLDLDLLDVPPPAPFFAKPMIPVPREPR